MNAFETKFVPAFSTWADKPGAVARTEDFLNANRHFIVIDDDRWWRGVDRWFKSVQLKHKLKLTKLGGRDSCNIWQVRSVDSAAASDLNIEDTTGIRKRD